MKHITIFTIFLLIASINLRAQNIENEAGIRLGGSTAFTYKKMFANLEAAEVMLSGRQGGLQLTGLYEKHKPVNVIGSDHFLAYYGFGGHLGYLRTSPVVFRDDSTSNNAGSFINVDQKTLFTMGCDAIFGIEYHIYAVPMSIALDCKPYLELVGMRYLKTNLFDFGLSAKYIF